MMLARVILAWLLLTTAALCQVGQIATTPNKQPTIGGMPASYSFVVFDVTSQVGGASPFTSAALTPAGGTSGTHQLCLVGMVQQNSQGAITNFKVNGSANMTNVSGFSAGTNAIASMWAGPCTIPAGTFTVTFSCAAPGFSDINLSIWVMDNLGSTTAISTATTDATTTIQSAASAGNFVFAIGGSPGGGTTSWSTSTQTPAHTGASVGAFGYSTAYADWVAGTCISAGNCVGTITYSGGTTNLDAAMAVYN